MHHLKIYAFVILFIGIWWGLAFKQLSPHLPPTDSNPPRLSSAHHSPFDTAISLVDRPVLLKALSGDFSLMARLIVDWDIEAQILISQGFKDIQRMSHADFLHSQSLIRTLQNPEATERSIVACHQCTPYIVDDLGNRIYLNLSYQRFLPQTYVAANFLLSLVPLNQIVALPRGLRNQTQLYPESLTNQITLDIDRYNAEKLFLAKPEIAFVAHYSHPATTQALAHQGIALYTMKTPSTLSDISKTLIDIGNIINKPLQAELMKIFIEAALYALDNQQTMLIKHFQERNLDLPKVLVVNYHHTFSVPTTQTLTGQLLLRMKSFDISLNYTLNAEKEWTVPIDKEKLLSLNPDFIVILAKSQHSISDEIYRDKALKELLAVRNNRLFFLDEFVQNSPSQYIALAYYDMIQTLMQML